VTETPLFALFPLQTIAPPMLERLARLHHAVLPTLLSQLGLPFVERYYRAAVADPRVIGFYAVHEQSGAPCGFAVGTPRPQALNSQLRQPPGWFAAQMARLLFQRPSLLWQLLASARAAAGQMADEPGAVELTYLGVAEEWRGHGLGSQLLQAFLDASRRAGYRNVVLSVETDNAAAIRLYRRTGFIIRKTFREGRFERHRMELILR
jgi:ribosomal protein S18 acetylase RimI-like enzyme